MHRKAKRNASGRDFLVRRESALSGGRAGTDGVLIANIATVLLLCGAEQVQG